MEKSRKQVVYWLSVMLYAIALTGVLLYVRFPDKRVKEYSEYRVEKWLPGVSCDIAHIGYEFPVKIVFKQMRLTGEEDGAALFEDPRLSLQPVWDRLTEVVFLESRAFGGNHSALVGIKHDDEGRIVLEEFDIKNTDVKEIPLFQRADRRIEGTLAGTGSAAINQQSLAVDSAEGNFTVSNLEFELNTPIFRLSTLALDQATFRFKVDQNVIDLQDGKITNPKIDGVFQGSVSLADPLLISKLALTGNIVPKAELFQGQRQMQAIVSGVQRRYNSDEVPFRVGGSINAPRFIFGQ